ncbi:hypothetical protein CYMTET_23485 [Cymbomonas tetramitiformis]|uniref:EGF-like domain-containing protein n=1 Tax=Cymbomonas tetramitiformis TaxID=36881 RepID=A0AAE0FY28_9CHLO|nr:hypothetical protein CYMTET_23485 [Cymbomonas tetramitiformis]
MGKFCLLLVLFLNNHGVALQESFLPQMQERPNEYASRCGEKCNELGTCNEEIGRCDCPAGFHGDSCEAGHLQPCELFPGYITPCSPDVPSSCECKSACSQSGYPFPPKQTCFYKRQVPPLQRECLTNEERAAAHVSPNQRKLTSLSESYMRRAPRNGFRVHGSEGQNLSKAYSFHHPDAQNVAAETAKERHRSMYARVHERDAAGIPLHADMGKRAAGWKMKSERTAIRHERGRARRIEEAATCPGGISKVKKADLEGYRANVTKVMLAGVNKRSKITTLPLHDCTDSCNMQGFCRRQVCKYQNRTNGNHIRTERWCGQDTTYTPGWFTPGTGWVVNTAQCECFFGYEGESCEVTSDVHCLNMCSGHGTCKLGFCHCLPGFFGNDCSLLVGPDGQTVRWLKNSTGLKPGEAPPSTHSKSLSPLIYVYDLPPHLNAHLYHELGYKRRIPQSEWYHPALEGPSGGDFFVGPAQLFLHEMFLTSKHRTTDPRLANFFFVPAWSRAADSTASGALHHYHKVLDYIQAKFPFWDRKSGADHMWVFPHDQGACEKSASYRIPPRLNNSIMLTHFGLTTSTAKTATHPYGCTGPCHRAGNSDRSTGTETSKIPQAPI